MPNYLHPGAYIEEISSGSKSIDAVGTSTACFIGYTDKGPVNNETVIDGGGFDPVQISDWNAYIKRFGGIRDTGSEELPENTDQMGYSVDAFFGNGGRRAYIIRTAISSSDKSLTESANSYEKITFTAANAGKWANDLVVQITGTIGLDQEGIAGTDKAEFNIAVGNIIDDDFISLEAFANVSLDPDSPFYIVRIINNASELLVVSIDGVSVADQVINVAAAESSLIADLFPATAGDAPAKLSEQIELTGGVDGVPGESADYDAVFTALLKYRDVNIICLPGELWPADGSPNSIVEFAIAHCETMKNCMVIVDPPSNVELATENQISDLALPAKSIAALYYPWVKVSNPYFDANTNPDVPPTILVAPSAYAAGMWTKIDRRRGVWKAPAGVETNLSGVTGFEYAIDDSVQDLLNSKGVNAFRKLSGFGRVIWGARTLATEVDPEWRYIPVRRTAMFIEESIYNGTQWAVFESNNQQLWSALHSNIGSFMNDQFRLGAFQGEKASDAYFVRCGLGDTMTQDDIDRGQVIVIVGFAPLKPAEFVIVRIQQKVIQE